MYLNNKLITKINGYQRMNQYDSIYFPWESWISKLTASFILSK